MKRVPTIIKGSGEREPWNVGKLIVSLERAGADKEVAEMIGKRIESQIKDGDTTLSIYKKAHKWLHKIKKPAAIRYSIRKAVAELGPTGYPFEDFLAEILKAKGFKTLTRQAVMGECVAHEVDVVAWNDK